MFSLKSFRLQFEHHLIIIILLIFYLEFSLFLSSGGALTEGAAFARIVISCTVEYKQLTMCTVYSVQLGPNPFHETNLHLNCKVLGLVRAKV